MSYAELWYSGNRRFLKIPDYSNAPTLPLIKRTFDISKFWINLGVCKKLWIFSLFWSYCFPALHCFEVLCVVRSLFTSLVTFTGSYTEDESKFQQSQTNHLQNLNLKFNKILVPINHE